MRPRPALSALALGTTAALLAAGAAPAGAATPAAGESASVLSVLQLEAGDVEVAAGVVQLLADTLAATPAAGVVVTPLRVGDEAVGQRTVSSDTGVTSVPAARTSDVAPQLAGLLEATGPSIGASAETTADSAKSTVGTGSLGDLSLLGLEVPLSGSVSAAALAGPSAAVGEQTLVLEDLALPSLDKILAALGLDLSAVPVEVLYALLDELALLTDTLRALKGELDAARSAIATELAAAEAAVVDALGDLQAAAEALERQEAELDAATKDAATKAAAVAPLQDARDAAQEAYDAAAADLLAAQGELTTALAGHTLAEYEASDELQLLLGPVVEPAKAAVAEAEQDLAEADGVLDRATADLLAAEDAAEAAAALVVTLQAAVDLARQAVADAEALLDAAYLALETLLETISEQIDALRAAVLPVLSDLPLLSLDRLEVTARTVVDSAAAGGQRAEIVGGEVEGLRVLGTDVLADVLNGASSVELLDLTDAQLDAVNDVIGSLTGTLSDALSDLPLFPTLDVPAPTLSVLTGEPRTGIEDGFGVASALVQVLTISMPSITLPVELALPDAATLPAFSVPGSMSAAAVTDDLTSRSFSLGIGAVGPQSRFRPAATDGGGGDGDGGGGSGGGSTPVTNNRPLPATGPAALVGLLGLTLAGAAALVHRRRLEQPED